MPRTRRPGDRCRRAQLAPVKAETDRLTASGFIEAEKVTIAPELGGRVVELLADEGDEVEAGQVLVRLDATLLEAQIEVTQAALDVAEAARDGVYQSWQDLIAIRDNP